MDTPLTPSPAQKLWGDLAETYAAATATTGQPPTEIHATQTTLIYLKHALIDPNIHTLVEQNSGTPTHLLGIPIHINNNTPPNALDFYSPNGNTIRCTIPQ